MVERGAFATEGLATLVVATRFQFSVPTPQINMYYLCAWKRLVLDEPFRAPLQNAHAPTVYKTRRMTFHDPVSLEHWNLTDIAAFIRTLAHYMHSHIVLSVGLFRLP